MVKLFTHTDLDGIGCEILAKIAFGKDVDVTNSEVSDINKDIKEFLDNPKNNSIYDKNVTKGGSSDNKSNILSVSEIKDKNLDLNDLTVIDSFSLSKADHTRGLIRAVIMAAIAIFIYANCSTMSAAISPLLFTQ